MQTTQIQKVKNIAMKFLYMQPDVNPALPILLAHPFFDSRAFPVRNESGYKLIDILENEENLNIARKQIEESIHSSKTPFDIINMMRDADKRTFFYYISDYLSNKDYAVLLRDTWINTEFPHFDTNISTAAFKKMFLKADRNYLMKKSELKAIDEMPEEIKIYRGIKGTYYKALSWSLSKQTAIWFANRFQENGSVFKATINKKDILAYFDDTEEKEVIVNYTKLKNITKIS